MTLFKKGDISSIPSHFEDCIFKVCAGTICFLILSICVVIDVWLSWKGSLYDSKSWSTSHNSLGWDLGNDH